MPHPRRLVLLGHPVAHSLSPRFQQAALDAAGIPLRYTAVDVPPADLVTTLRTLRDEGAAGNITIPHKRAALDACDEVTPLAQAVGAVNTFWTDADGRLHGDNTDVGGFAAAVAALWPGDLAGLRVLLIGAGGAALAVREAAANWPGASLAVLARDAGRAAALLHGSRVSGRVVAGDAASVQAALRDADLVVNATPLGLGAADAMPVPPEWLGDGTVVLDLTYRAEGPTAFVEAARARGIRADDGLRMLVEQGALAFERWFARSAPRDVMLAAVGR